MTGAFEEGKREYETGRWSKAFQLFQKALRDRDRIKEVRLLMARCLLRMGEHGRAQEELKALRQMLSEADRELLEAFAETWNQLDGTSPLHQKPEPFQPPQD